MRGRNQTSRTGARRSSKTGSAGRDCASDQRLDFPGGIEAPDVAMKDYLAQVEKLRRDAAECALIRDLATDQAKREMFDRLASHLTILADQVEMAMMQRKNGTK